MTIVRISVLAFAFLAVLAGVATAQPADPGQTVSVSETIIGAQLLPAEGKDWTLSFGCAQRSAFKAFGSVASDDPICSAGVSYGDGKWNVSVLTAQPVGEHAPGVIAGYHNVVGTREWERGDWTINAGLEVFYSPAYRGGFSNTFIAPIGVAEYAASEQVTLRVGGQYLGTHNTRWEGERTYGYIEGTYEVPLGDRWIASVTGGGIASNSGRRTVHGGVAAEYAVGDLTVIASGLIAETKERGRESEIPFTGTLTLKYDF